MLNDQQIERYSRHIILPEVGARGQERLLSAAVAVVGDGHHAATAALYLAAGGIGVLAVSEAMRADLAEVNPDCHVVSLPPSIGAAEAAAIAQQHDVVVACNAADDVTVELNRACIAARTPLVWGRLTGSGGAAVVCAGDGAHGCHACLVGPAIAATEATCDITGVAAGFIATVQATEAIKLILGVGEPLWGRVIIYDAGDESVRQTTPARDPRCALCGAEAARRST